MGFARVKKLLGRTFREWKDDGAMQWGAALAYYAALAIAPLLLLLLMVAALILDEEMARQQMVAQLEEWMGPQGADLGRTIFQQSGEEEGGGWLAGISGSLLLMFGASGIFAQLQKALNDLWDVELEEGGIRHLVTGRILGFALALGLGLLLFTAMVLQTAVTAIVPGVLGSLLNLGGSLVVFTLLFAALFKVLPDVDIHWKEVWVGAGATALLFVLGQALIGLYLGRSSPGSAYGAAGSLVALLVWIYYSSQTLFFGAEFTQVWARDRGRRIEPEKGARRKADRPSGPSSTREGGGP